MVNTPSLPVGAPLGDDDRDVFVPFVGLFSGIPRWRWRLRSIIPPGGVHRRPRNSPALQWNLIAPRVVDPLPHIGEFPGPVYDQVHQEQFTAGEMPENIVEFPVVREQVIVQAIPGLLILFLLFNSLLGPGFFMFIMNILLQSLRSPSFSRCLMMRVTQRGVPGHPVSVSRGGHRIGVQLRTVEQLADVVPMVQVLDIPEPQGVDKLVEACRHLDLHIPEHVIEVPKISSSRRRCRRRRVPVVQTAEQLVEVPTPSPAHVPVPRMEDQLVEVPQIVTHIVPRSFFVSTDTHTPVDPLPPPHRDTPPGQGGIQILAKGEWTSLRPCSSCSSSPSRLCTVPRFSSSTECWTFQLCHRREIPQCSS